VQFMAFFFFFLGVRCEFKDRTAQRVSHVDVRERESERGRPPRKHTSPFLNAACAEASSSGPGQTDPLVAGVGTPSSSEGKKSSVVCERVF